MDHPAPTNDLKKTKQIAPLWADFSLLFVALSWGATFIIVKTAVEDLPPFPFLATRFGIAFLFLVPLLWSRREYINISALLKGIVLGTFLFGGYASQTIGLQYTTASNAGFITGLNVVMVPILVAVYLRKIPHFTIIMGTLSAALGLAFLSLGDNFIINKGDPIVLICAFCFALHIFFVGRYAPDVNAVVLAAVQILTVSVLSGIFTLTTPQPPMAFTPYVWFGLFLTAVICTSLAFFLQSKMQQFTSPSHTAIIFASEPVFGAVFAYLLGGEILGRRGIIGAFLVLTGILTAEYSNLKKTVPEKAAK